MVILASTRVKDALQEHPELKEVIISLSPRFKLLNNPAVFKTVSKWSTFGDIAKVGDLSVCELLHRVNSEIGMEEELLRRAPNCIKNDFITTEKPMEAPDWVKEASQIVILDVRDRSDFFLPTVIKELAGIKNGQILKVTNAFYPAPLIEMLKEDGYELFYDAPSFHEHILYIKSRKKPSAIPWQERKDEFPLMDTASWGKDFFSLLVKEAEGIPPNTGIKLVLRTSPEPIVNTVETLGLESFVEKTADQAYTIYFYKPMQEEIKGTPAVLHKVPLVIQSATPVVYPVLMRLLESKRLLKEVRIDELKVWDKTEKHLGWIVNKRADISFSAVAAVAKLYQKNLDIIMPAIVVWDNFFVLTRDFVAKDFSDLKGHDIYLPLIKAAPPYAVTSFLMQKLGYNPDEFNYVFGKPFGRPEEIQAALVNGRAEVALLREPEASFAIYDGKGSIQESIAYENIWKNIFPGQGSLPNAGVLFKGEVMRQYPDLARLFMEETEKAAEWVHDNPAESAKMIAEIMSISPEKAALFLSRVHLNFVPSKNVIDEITHYLDVLNKSGYGSKPFGELKPLFI